MKKPTATQLNLWSGASRSHASRSVTPGSNKAQQMTAGSGQSFSALLKESDPGGYLSKMLLESSIWRSTVCYLTWKGKGTPARRSYYQLVPSMPDTGETEFGLWPTLRASEWKSVGPLHSKSHEYRLNRRYLDATVQEVEQSSGHLNPNWLEWLMGFPIGWTELED